METIHNIRKKIILTADDFGLSPVANENILALVKLGKIDRVAVMANYDLVEKEIETLIQSGVKIDIHLNLKDFDKKTLRGKGVAQRSLIFLWHYFSGQIKPAKIAAEWEDQIELFIRKFKKIPDGINSHQHIHFFPANFAVILALAKKYQIPHLRFAHKSLHSVRGPVSTILNTLRHRDAKTFSESTLKTTDYLVSLDWIKSLDKFLANRPEGQTELVCHPERKGEFDLVNKYF